MKQQNKADPNSDTEIRSTIEQERKHLQKSIMGLPYRFIKGDLYSIVLYGIKLSSWRPLRSESSKDYLKFCGQTIQLIMESIKIAIRNGKLPTLVTYLAIPSINI